VQHGSCSDEAFDGALLVAAFFRDVHLIRTSFVELKYPEQDVDGS
jgi:hypothetical protein